VIGREPLSRYFGILEGRFSPVFKVSKSIYVDFDPEDDLKKLWEMHERILPEMYELRENEVREKKTKETKDDVKNFLGLKLAIARKILRRCEFCERRCKVDRSVKTGWCRAPSTSYYSSEFLHMGEEEVLIPSHTIFFSGCVFRCVYCQNWDISQYPLVGFPVQPKELAGKVDIRHRQGSRNVNFVTPTPHVHTVLEILMDVSENVPVVWNSNMYHSSEVAELLKGVVDVYLGDFKYGNDGCAERLSNVRNYSEIVRRNFLIAYEDAEIILRHLVLPNHVGCCTRHVIEWVCENIPDVLFNLMFQYRPEYSAFEYPEIARRLSGDEMLEALKYAKKLRYLYT